MDGYLAVEFLSDILGNHLPGLAMEEWSAKEMKPIKDHITPFFTELAGISSKIAVGNITQLYDVCNGEGIAAYTEADGTLLLYTKGEDNLIALERKLGLIKE